MGGLRNPALQALISSDETQAKVFSAAPPSSFSELRRDKLLAGAKLR